MRKVKAKLIGELEAKTQELYSTEVIPKHLCRQIIQTSDKKISGEEKYPKLESADPQI